MITYDDAKKIKLKWGYKSNTNLTTLAEVLEITEKAKYEVFVTKKADANLCKFDARYPTLNTTDIISIIRQMVTAVEELKRANKSHNDLKPANVLIVKKEKDFDYFEQDDLGELDDCFYDEFEDKLTQVEYQVRIVDFGTCGKRGGTPGWTAPIFLSERKPGVSDLYSVGLISLYLLCAEIETFYCLRDNFVDRIQSSWIKKFRSLPEISIILDMINLVNPMSIEECLHRWNQTDRVKLITRKRLIKEIRVPSDLLEPQYKDDTKETKIQ